MWAVMTQREKMTDNGLTHAILGKREGILGRRISMLEQHRGNGSSRSPRIS
jgi:hypothetical protein